MRTALCCLGLLGSAGAQQLSLELRLAPGSAREGSAWQELRRSILPRLPGWPNGLDPQAALQLSLQLPWRLEAGPATAPTEGRGRPLQFAARLELEGLGSLQGRRLADGREVWTGQHLEPPRGRLRYLCRLAGFEAEQASARSMLPMLAHLCGGPLTLPELAAAWLALGPRVETFRARLHQLAPGLRLESPAGEAGILLPAALLLSADLWARPEHGALCDGPAGSRSDALLMAALAGTGLDRQAAIQALADNPDPRVTPTLLALLNCHDVSRNLAMQALSQRADPRVRARIAQAASQRVLFAEFHAAHSLRLAAARVGTAPSAEPGSLLRLHPQLEVPGLGFGPHRHGLELPLRRRGQGQHAQAAAGMSQWSHWGIAGLLVCLGLGVLWYSWYHLQP